MDVTIIEYGSELLTVTMITILAVISPGPDFAVVTRNSLAFSRRSGILTALGISIANWIHVFYTLAGIGVIISKSLILFSIIKFLGAAYLVYLGITNIRNTSEKSVETESGNNIFMNDINSFKTGFITNALNPKATVFYVSVFAQLVSTTTPIYIQFLYGAIASLFCLIWFTLVAIFFNHHIIKSQFIKAQKPLEKIMGVILVGFGIKVALGAE